MKIIAHFWRPSALLLFVLSIFFTAACTQASSRDTRQEPQPPAIRNPYLRDLVAQYDRYFDYSMLSSHTPGAALVIVKDSVIIFQKGYGLKAVNKVLDSVGVHTVFRIGSLSKGFAGVLTGILVEEGDLKWDDRIVRYVPEFSLSSPEQTRQVQLRHLLSHTSGLPYHAYTNMIEAGYDLRSIAQKFSKLKLHGKPGQVFSYQNAAFSLVGEAMTATTGKNYPTLLQRKIFEPAGMHNASADWEGIQKSYDRALPHRGLSPDSITHRFYNAAPAGGVNASIADMGEWLLLLLGYKPNVVSVSTLDQVFQPVIRTGSERKRFSQSEGRVPAYYAMGWRVLTSGQDTIVYHGGAVNDFRSEIAFNRRDGIGICVLFNASTPLANSCIADFWELYSTQRDSILNWTQPLVD